MATPQPPRLIVMGGLPGSGKSTVADGLARRFGLAILSTDQIDGTLRRCGYDGAATGVSAYLVVETLAREQLRRGVSVIVDAVNPREAAREMWRRLAAEESAELKVIECVCDDEALLRARIEGRVRDIPGLPAMSWPHLLRRKATYDAWTEPRLTLVTESAEPAELIESAAAYLEAGSQLETEAFRRRLASRSLTTQPEPGAAQAIREVRGD